MTRDSEAGTPTLRRGSTLVDTLKRRSGIERDAALTALRELDLPERRYSQGERIGLGGMGEVSSVFDGKIGREVALKTMLPVDPIEAAALELRFLREARIQAVLEHPAVVPVYDMGVDASGAPYFTMKRVRGSTLATVLAEQTMLRRSGGNVRRHRLLTAFTTVCLAVDHAHRHGVVHRDLKPENIMLGSAGEVYILDWGLALMRAPSGAGDGAAEAFLDSTTAPGEMVGTPGYMPPEQALGETGEIDQRSDVYSLGTILYEILALKPFHDGDGIAELITSTLDPQHVAPAVAGVPPELHALVLRATRFKKTERASSARSLADAVERYLDGDRDETMRAKLAGERSAAARALLEEAGGARGEERSMLHAKAMRTAGSALAISPTHPEATQLVLELLAAPPSDTPAELKLEMDKIELDHARTAMRDNALRVCSWLLLAPVGVLMGVVRGEGVAALMALMIACAVAAIVIWRRTWAGRAPRLALCGLTSLFFAVVSGLFGPFVLVPVLASVNCVLFSVQAPRRERLVIIGFGLLTFLVPMALELLGIIPSSFVFADGTITLHPRIIAFPPVLTFAFLATVSTFSIVTPTILTGRLRDALRSSEEALLVQKWKFAHLAPHPERMAAAPGGSRSSARPPR